MSTMRALVVVEPGRVELREVPMPRPGPYQALAKIEACSFCSSTDVKIAAGELPFVNQYPCIIGHEALGRVIEPGPKARYLTEGLRLLRATCAYPGTMLGEYYSGWGGMAEYGLVTDLRAMVEDLQIRADQLPAVEQMHQPVPPEMSAPDGTMLITLKETLSSLQDMGMRPGARVLVVGDGAVGLAFAYWAKVMGASKAVVAGHHEARLAQGRKLGLDAAVNSSGKTLGEAVASDPAAAGPFDFVIDAVGHHKIVEEGIPLLAAWGTLAVYGTSTHLKATVDVMAIPVGARLLRASTDEPRVHTQVLEACRMGLIRPSDFYSHVLPLERAAEGLELLRRRDALKVVVVMD